MSPSAAKRPRAILVTGASSGIGLASAANLVQKGFQVFGGVRPGKDHTHLSAAGVRPVSLDVTDAESLAAALETVQSELGDSRLWGLVNCAGVVSAGPVEMHNLSEARSVFDVNVMGVLATTQTFLPLIRQEGGRVVNVSSLSGLLAMPFMGPYNASKAALESLSDTMRRELKPFGVDVIAIQPGTTKTSMWNKAEQIDVTSYKGTPYEHAAAKLKDEAVRKGLRGQAPDQVAAAVVRAFTAKRPPTRIRVQRKRLSFLFYSLLPFLSDRVIDRKIIEAVWGR